MDLVAFMRSAALAEPYPNPAGGRHWYHGTHQEYWSPDEDEDTENDIPRNHKDWVHETEWFENHGNHWNTALGTHWSSEYETASQFAGHGQYDNSRIAHAHLHMRNPKHYKSEFEMDGDAVRWAHANGYKHLPDSDHAHKQWKGGGEDAEQIGDDEQTRSGFWADGRQRWQNVPYEQHPYTYEGNDDDRREISNIDRDDDLDEHELATKHRAYLGTYLRSHPFREDITRGFKQHLIDKGHDGIIYGNEYEGSARHPCAIPFDDDQVNLKRWEPIGNHNPQAKQEREQRQQIPGQQEIVTPQLPDPITWKGWNGKEASKKQDEVDEIMGLLGGPIPRLRTVSEATGEASHVPTPSATTRERPGYFPGEDLTGIDKGPKVGWVRVDRLKQLREYDRRGSGANAGSAENIDRIRASMRQTGMTDPVILAHDPHSDRAYLCEGNHRLAAAEEEGWPAVPVHVVRAYRSESEKMSHQHYLGAHKVVADDHGYTPGNLHPRDVLPDSWLHEGDAGLRPKTGSMRPAPKYHKGDDIEAAQEARRAWQREVKYRLSTGSLSPQEAQESGYQGNGHDTDSNGDLSWQHLPEHLYHVTTDVAGVLKHGLQTRSELGQRSGKGLGGGTNDTISFTDDPQVAGHILEGLHEFHSVLNGKRTPAEMWDEAQTGQGAARPFHKDLAKMYGSRDGEVTAGLRDVLEGKKTKRTGMVITKAEMHESEPGREWEPHPDSEPYTGATDGVVRHNIWQTDATDDERRENNAEFFKRFSAFREYAGGRMDPLFFSTDTEGFRKMDPSNFGILHCKPRPGAQGHPVGSMREWRTCSGDAVDVVHHRKTAERDYAGGHQPPSDGSPLHDAGRTFPGLYERPYDYTHGGSRGYAEPYDHESVDVVRRARGNPEMPVRVYRSLPPHAEQKIHPGDWVALSHSYAAQHGAERGWDEWVEPKDPENIQDHEGWIRRDGDWPVVSAVTKAKHIRDGGNDIIEWGYHGPDVLDDDRQTPTKTAAKAGPIAYHATRALHWPPEDQMVHVGTADAALDRAVSTDDLPSHWDAHEGPADSSRWRVHEVKLHGRVYPHVLTDEQANDLAEGVNWQARSRDDIQRVIDGLDLRHAGLDLPTHPRGYHVFPYINDTEGNGALSYLVHPGAVRVIRTHDLGPTSYARTARWLPHARIFGPGHGGLDPRLFDPKTKRMIPEVESVILGDLDAYWGKTYPDWRNWTRVYLAGSQASEWYGNNDFDTLLGVEHKRLRQAHPEFADMLDDDIDTYLTKGLREHLNNEEWQAPWDGQIWHRTFYVNPNSWDIRKIKPYAAYDITRRRWIVEPVHPPSDWGPEKLPSAFWDEAESIVKQVHAIEAMPEPMRSGRAAALFDYLHSDRRRAFGPHGTGVYDPGNATWKYLDLHPDKPLSILIDLKRRYEDAVAREATA